MITMMSVLLIGIMVPLLLLIWGIKQPLVWVVVSVLAIGGGVGCAGYGFTQAVLGNQPPQPLDSHQIAQIGIFIGAGIGSTVAGIVLLIVGLVRCRNSAKVNP